MSAHYHEIDDDNGDLADLVVFCSDWCHRVWCWHTKNKYQGWNGCHELPEPTNCVSCATIVN